MCQLNSDADKTGFKSTTELPELLRHLHQGVVLLLDVLDLVGEDIIVEPEAAEGGLHHHQVLGLRTNLLLYTT